VTKKKYLLISGFNILDDNRGTAALSYGSISFLIEKGYLRPEQELVNIQFVKKFWKDKYKTKTENMTINGRVIKHTTYYVFELEWVLFDKCCLLLSRIRNVFENVELVAAINGGDGFSDIYNTKTFLSRLSDIKIAMKLGIPVIQLPQTLGPFTDANNYLIAKSILQYSKKVYVRDDKFVNDLDEMNVRFERTKDLSAFMMPEPWNIDIMDNAVGINVSGLAYDNRFRGLTGQFDQYPYIVMKIIECLQSFQIPVYIIPHSYNYTNPIQSEDDLLASRDLYSKLKSKHNVVLVDDDLISPQVKYVISKMKYFIGTRMHANFAAIYSGVPVYGLAYSYKFEGAFKANGVFDDNMSKINDVSVAEADEIVSKVIDHIGKVKGMNLKTN